MSDKRVSYISASQIEMFLGCPMCYKRIYVNKAEREPPSIYLAWGGAIHEAFEYNYAQKIASRKDLPVDEVVEYFENAFTKQLKGVPADDWKRAGLMQMQGEEMVREYMRTQAPNIQPVAVEHKFMLDLGEGLIINGFIDLIDENGIIHDYKTCSKSTAEKWSQAYVDRMVQLTMYSIAYRKDFKKAENGLCIDVLKRLKSGPRIESIHTTRTEAQTLNLVQLMLVMNYMTQNDLWYAHPYTCGNHCEWHMGEPVFQPQEGASESPELSSSVTLAEDAVRGTQGQETPAS